MVAPVVIKKNPCNCSNSVSSLRFAWLRCLEKVQLKNTSSPKKGGFFHGEKPHQCKEVQVVGVEPWDL